MRLPRICIALYLYSSFLTFISLIPVTLTPVLRWQDKFLHGCAYLLLALLATIAFRALSAHRAYLLGFTYAFSLGLLIEGAQLFIPYRQGEWKDLIANAVGSLIGVSIVHIAKKLANTAHEKTI